MMFPPVTDRALDRLTPGVRRILSTFLAAALIGGVPARAEEGGAAAPLLWQHDTGG